MWSLHRDSINAYHQIRPRLTYIMLLARVVYWIEKVIVIRSHEWHAFPLLMAKSLRLLEGTSVWRSVCIISVLVWKSVESGRLAELLHVENFIPLIFKLNCAIPVADWARLSLTLCNTLLVQIWWIRFIQPVFLQKFFSCRIRIKWAVRNYHGALSCQLNPFYSIVSQYWSESLYGCYGARGLIDFSPDVFETTIASEHLLTVADVGSYYIDVRMPFPFVFQQRIIFSLVFMWKLAIEWGVNRLHKMGLPWSYTFYWLVHQASAVVSRHPLCWAPVWWLPWTVFIEPFD